MNLQIGDIVIPLPPFGQLVFLTAAGVAALGAVMMITRRQAVHSALWLVVVFFNLAVMYVMLGAEFLAALQQANFGDTIGNTQVVWNAAAIAAIGGNVQALGNTLYTQFLLPFEVASLILLLAIIGAIVLARKEEPVEVEEVLPSLGISLGRRSIANSPQEEQFEKKLRGAMGLGPLPDGATGGREFPVIQQPSGVGAGTTSGVDVEPPPPD